MRAERTPRRTSAAAAVALLAALAAPPAGAQDGGPSARELWNSYPLEATPQATATPAPAVPRSAERPLPARTDDGGSGLEAIGVLAVLVGGVLAFILVSRRRRGARGPSPAAASPAEPPERPRTWRAEIERRDAPDAVRFVAMARSSRGATPVTVAESPPLRRPPAGDPQELFDAVTELSRALVAAGWRRAPAGTAWHAQRFTCEAVGPPPAAKRTSAVPARKPNARSAKPAATAKRKPAAATKRKRAAASKPAAKRKPAAASKPAAKRKPATATKPPARRKPDAPQGGARAVRDEDPWRGEIGWNPARSRFEAVAYAPGRRRGRTVAASRSLNWQLAGEPDPSSMRCRDELANLASALEDAGWEALGAGDRWYASRFVWRQEAPPPEQLNHSSKEAT